MHFNNKEIIIFFIKIDDMHQESSAQKQISYVVDFDFGLDSNSSKSASSASFLSFFYKAIHLDTLYVTIGNTEIKVHHFFIDSFSLKDCIVNHNDAFSTHNTNKQHH